MSVISAVSIRPGALLAVVAACVASACGGTQTSAAAPSPASAQTQFLTYQSAGLTFRYTSLDSPTIAKTAVALEAEYGRITEDLSVAQMPTVVITLYPTIESLREAVAPVVGALPSFAKGLVTGVDAVHILSPNVTAAWPYADAVVGIVHEFAHCVSLRLNPSFGNNPRWLWESVALFEAGQYTDPRSRPYFSVGPLPSIAQLNAFDNTVVYDVGATFGLFVVDTRGWDSFRSLIRANGDVARVLGVSESAFLNEWAMFVRGFFHVT
jgi:hypothetical protein